jgi:hypothetical protein
VFEAPYVLTWIVSACPAAGQVIGQLNAGEDTGLTRFYLVNRETPCMLHEPSKNIEFETLLNSYRFRDRSFEATEIKYGLFEDGSIE